MARVAPYITFNNICREAFEFYHQCLGGDLFLQTVGDSPAAEHMPPESHQYILHASLTAGDVTVLGSDMFRKDEGLSRGNDVSLTYMGTPDEVRELFAKLSEGGTVRDELRVEFFGLYGALTDKFGVRWMLQADTKPQTDSAE